ncbi:MAG: preprotein translocase subunit YajC [Firmicutes bacterium]|nr:preprotein translocase subunit YajC [Bacillota bacterium]
MKDLVQYAPLVVIFVIFYFLLIRPQQRRSKERNAMMASIGMGDHVVTIGGIHGTVSELRDSTVVLKVADGTKVEFERSAVNSIREKGN